MSCTASFVDTYNVSYAVNDISVKTVVGITCCLAMVGSLFVILSFLLFKSLRSEARQILVNLSLMDFGIAMANMTGIAANFDGYFSNRSEVNVHMEGFCKAQAFVAMFSTYSSILWTISLAIYMYLLVFQIHRYPLRYYLFCCYAFCYGISFGLSLWLLLTNRLGYAPFNSSGWCTIIVNNVTVTDNSSGSVYYNASGIVENISAQYGHTTLLQNRVPEDSITDTLVISTTDYCVAIFGYDLWIYLAIITCVTLYLALFLQLRFGVSYV